MSAACPTCGQLRSQRLTRNEVVQVLTLLGDFTRDEAARALDLSPEGTWSWINKLDEVVAVGWRSVPRVRVYRVGGATA